MSFSRNNLLAKIVQVKYIENANFMLLVNLINLVYWPFNDITKSIDYKHYRILYTNRYPIYYCWVDTHDILSYNFSYSIWAVFFCIFVLEDSKKKIEFQSPYSFSKSFETSLEKKNIPATFNERRGGGIEGRGGGKFILQIAK